MCLIVRGMLELSKNLLTWSSCLGFIRQVLGHIINNTGLELHELVVYLAQSVWSKCGLEIPYVPRFCKFDMSHVRTTHCPSFDKCNMNTCVQNRPQLCFSWTVV